MDRLHSMLGRDMEKQVRRGGGGGMLHVGSEAMANKEVEVMIID